MIYINDFVEFTGEETEKEFLEKCLEQWKLTGNSSQPDVIKMCQIGTVFNEIRHRLEELKGE